MIELSESVLIAIGEKVGRIESIRPVRPSWRRLLGFDRNATRPFRIETSGGRLKMVALQPPFVTDAARRRSFAKTKQIFRRLQGTGALPALVAEDDRCIVTEWLEGITLDRNSLRTEADLAALADCVCSAYALMVECRNPIHRDDLSRAADTLGQRGLLSASELSEVSRCISVLDIPSHVRKGPCFSDVALANFVFRPDGSVAYIDTMGVENDVMGLNMQKLAIHLGPDREAAMLGGIERRYVGSTSHLDFMAVSLCLRQALAKSQGGEGLVARRRRQKSRQAIERLIDITRSHEPSPLDVG